MHKRVVEAEAAAFRSDQGTRVVFRRRPAARDAQSLRLIVLPAYRMTVEVDDHVVGDVVRSARCSLSMFVPMQRYCGAGRRWLIRTVEDGGGEQVASSILSAVESAGSEALPALAILRAAMEPTSVFRL